MSLNIVQQLSVIRNKSVQPIILQLVRTAHSKAKNHAETTTKLRSEIVSLPSLKKRPREDSHAISKTFNELERISTSSLLRSIFLGAIFTSPLLVRLTMPIMHKIANSQSIFFSPERNPLVKSVTKSLVYNQFCAGENSAEVAESRRAIRSMGFAGIILCCGQEIQIMPDAQLRSTISSGDGKQQTDEISQWKDGYLATLDMIGKDDWIGMKMTGAGTKVTQALMQNKPPPPDFLQAMHEICDRAAAQNCRVWMDAEQQMVQTSIDAWTIDLMRKYNRRPDGRAVIYNTLQAYLKNSRDKLKHQLALAESEGWTLAIKLVRGAYISNDQREKIHDTKADTDRSYDGLVSDILQGTNLGYASEGESGGRAFPKMHLFIAGHNPESVAIAADLVEGLQLQGRLKVLPDFGQLQGMADVLGCRLLKRCEEMDDDAATKSGATSERSNEEGKAVKLVVPKVYKCLTWGSVQECIQYLLRRFIENSGASDRMRDGLSAYSAELRRRVGRAVWPIR